MSIRVGINGFGRIGRNIFRANAKQSKLDIVAINDITTPETLAHLLKYDSVHGKLEADVRAEGDGLSVGNQRVRVLAERDPGKLPWKDLGVDIVLECSGLFTDRAKAAAHLNGGAKKVIISAPAKGADMTICFGVNHTQYNGAEHHVVSNASCTTNCLAPIAKVLHERFGIKRGLMTTIHAYTNDQRILDLPHEDMRRARAAAINIIPTTTGMSKAISEVIPDLKGKIEGVAFRVPVPTGSLIDCSIEVARDCTKEEVNAALKKASEGSMKGVLGFSDEPIVSSDIVHDPHSSIIDSLLTNVVQKRVIKVVSWYDNEWGFSNRMADLMALAAKLK